MSWNLFKILAIFDLCKKLCIKVIHLVRNLCDNQFTGKLPSLVNAVNLQQL